MTDKIEQMVAVTAGMQRGLPQVEIQKMTDNEKAATFIGWRPHAHRRDGGCLREDLSLGCDLPDMTDPRNYMKALTTIGKPFCIEMMKLSEHNHYRVHLNCDWDYHGVTSGDPPTAFRDSDESIPTAIVSALAALYDAEHAGNARMKG